MPDKSDNLTIQILRQIQGDLTDVKQALSNHDRLFERMQQQIDYRFDGVERKMGELFDTSTKAPGTASVANVRHDSSSQRFVEPELELREMRDRLRRLEEKV